MAKFAFRINLFLILLLSVLWPTLVNSSEPGDFTGDYGNMPIEEQQIFGAERARLSESVICNHKKALVHNLEQLSFYLKADCQVANSSAVGCSCWPPSCDARCTPHHPCCPQNTTALLAELEGFNAFYASHFKDVFSDTPKKSAQLEE